MVSASYIKKQFKNKDLFNTALTHKSWVNENHKIRQSNERLEFLGDAVLEFIVSSEIFTMFPDKEEGFLTSLRASLVNTQNLSIVSKKIGLGEMLYLSRGEKEGGGHENISLLADSVEALIGAIYLDRGISAVKKFISDNLLSSLPEKLKNPLKDPKSRLQEEVQSYGFPPPKYLVTGQSGPDHSKIFRVDVVVDYKVLANGSGKSKNEAEQVAAQKGLDKMKEKR